MKYFVDRIVLKCLLLHLLYKVSDYIIAEILNVDISYKREII